MGWEGWYYTVHRFLRLLKLWKIKSRWNKDERKKKRWRNKKYVRCGRREW